MLAKSPNPVKAKLIQTANAMKIKIASTTTPNRSHLSCMESMLFESAAPYPDRLSALVNFITPKRSPQSLFPITSGGYVTI